MPRAFRFAVALCLLAALGLSAGACGDAPSSEPTGQLLLQRGTTREPPQLVSFDLSTGEERVVVPAPAADGRWSPDGEHIAYTHDDGSGPQIRIVDSSGGAPLTVSQSGGDAMPAWSPDCTQIAFVRFDVDGDGSEIWVMDADGSNRRQVTSGTGLNTGVDWSPTGDTLVMMGDRGGDAEIIVVNLDGSAERQLTDNTVGDTWPRWSPDRSQIAFARRVNERKQIFVMDADGSNEVQLTTGAQGGEFPVWSPDGQWIAYQQAGGPVTIMRPDLTDRTDPRQLKAKGIPADWAGGTRQTCESG